MRINAAGKCDKKEQMIYQSTVEQALYKFIRTIDPHHLMRLILMEYGIEDRQMFSVSVCPTIIDNIAQ